MDSETPLVSILVPIYNVEPYLRECLETLTDQTLDNIEIICIDDGSTDGSLDIVKEFAARDPRIKIITKPNAGYGDSMNRGLDRATGKYIGIVESDDLALHTMFEKLYALAEANNLDVVKSNFFTHATYTAPDEDPVLDNLVFCPKDVVFDPLECQEIFLTQPAIWSALYRRDFLVDNAIRFLETPGASFQDTSFNYRVFALAKRVMAVQDAFLHYRIDNANSSVKSQAKIFCICDEYEEMWRFTAERPEVLAALGKRLPQIQFGGYRWNLERLTPALQPAFYDRMVAAFQKMQEAGLLDKAYFDDIAWRYLQDMLADPDAFFYNTYGPRAVETTYVVRLPELSEQTMRKYLGALLAEIGENDEVIVVDSFDGRESVPAFAKYAQGDSRLFSDIDLWKCAAIQEIDRDRIRGSRFVALSVKGKPSGAALKQALAQAASSCSSVNDRGDKGSVAVTCFKVESSLPATMPLLFALAAHDALDVQLAEADMAALSGRLEGVSDALQRRVLCAGHLALSDYQDVLQVFQTCIDTAFEGRELTKTGVTAEPASPALVEWFRQVLAPLWTVVNDAYRSLSYNKRMLAGEKPHSGQYPALTIAPGAADEGTKKNADQPDITVVIPVYNVEDYLPACLESVLCQEEVSLEVICIDDGSSDASLSILQEIAEVDDRLCVYTELNGGAGSARNRGIELARGHYFAFIDPDDYYPSNVALAHLHVAAKKHRAKMCGGSFISFLPSGETKLAYHGNEASYTIAKAGFQKFEQDQFDYGWIRFIYASDLFTKGKLRFPDYRWYEDPVFYVNAMKLVKRFYVIPEPVYCYREDYKEPSWSVEQVRDMLAGIAHNLAFAVENNYNTLYARLIRRINHDYCEAIMSYLDDREVLSRITDIQASLEVDRVAYLKERGYVVYVLNPLYYRLCEERKTAIGRLATKIERSGMYKTMQSYYEKFRKR